MPNPTDARLRLRRALLAQLGLSALGLATARSARAQAETFVMVVHPSNPERSQSREFLADAFLKRTTRWPNGEAIKPVDLRADSRVRKAFSEGVLKRSVAAVRSYWQQRIFSGRGVPPPELESDEAVLRYVATHPGAVGYVSAEANLEKVKLLSVT